MSARADLILRNVRPHGGVACDVAITGGRITAMAQRLKGDRGPTLRKAVAWAKRTIRETQG